jgi:hypothetical protein
MAFVIIEASALLYACLDSGNPAGNFICQRSMHLGCQIDSTTKVVAALRCSLERDSTATAG